MFSRGSNFIDVIWSPIRDDQFIAFDTDLYLFQTVNSKSHFISENLKKLCDETYVELIANYGENSNPRVISWQKGNLNQCLFAVYFQNQKIQLIEFKQNRNGDNSNRKDSIKNFEILKEFSFKQVRQCSNLAFNPFEENILAAGFSERLRTEHSILIWDITGSSNPLYKLKFDLNTESAIYINDLSSQFDIINKSSFYSSQKKLQTIKPLYETSISETCFSLSWNSHKEHNLLAGLEHGKAGKLKIIDIRAKNKGGLTVNTKFIQGFAVDSAPNSTDYLAASYHENVVALWDLRNFLKPLDQITEQDHILKMQWCPTKCGNIATLTKNSISVNIYSVKVVNNSLNINVIEDENAPLKLNVDKIINLNYPLSNTKQAKNDNKNSLLSKTPSTDEHSGQLNNFCWYNFDTNKILVATVSKNLMALNLFNTFILEWSAIDDLCWSSNSIKINTVVNLYKNLKEDDDYDFMSLFRERSKADYGLKYEIITIVNGNATSLSSNTGPFSIFQQQQQHSSQQIGSSTNTNTTGSSAIPLALALNTMNGLSTLIRSDFIYNSKICDLRNSSLENFTNSIKFLWQWFETTNRLYEIGIPLNPPNNLIRLPPNSRGVLIDRYNTRYCGLRTLLNDFINKRPNLPDLQSTHDDRFKTICYYLCGWDFKDGTISRQFFSNLEMNNQFERACCLALLTQNTEQSLEILDTASKADSRYGCLWIALNYSNQQSKQQRDQTSTRHVLIHQNSLSPNNNLKSTPPSAQNSQNSFNRSPYYSLNDSFDFTYKNNNSTNSNNTDSGDVSFNLKEYSKLVENFNDPYLKALFNYLINRDEAIMNILRDRNILFQDRIALAVFFMYSTPDKQKQLLEYFDWLIEEECIINADLHGILLTGLGPKCIDIFQSFIDKTNDVQTVCNAIIHSPYSDVIQSKQVEYWINCYRDLLNRFKFWEKRAKFDVFKMKLLKSQNLVSSYNSTSSTLSHSNSQILSSRVQISSSSLLNSNNLNSLTNNQNIHLICNQCGKNVYLESQYLPNININSFKFNSNNNSNKFNDPFSTILGCSNCSKFLPKCTICLRLMKINLNPNPNINSNSFLITNPNHILMTGQYLPSPKINIYPKGINMLAQSNIAQNQLQFHFKSPNSANQFDKNSNSIFKLNGLNEAKEVDKSYSKYIFSNENMYFIKINRFGNFYSFCLQCKHGGHIKHLLQWFKNNKKCPYIHCQCECINIEFS